ncbi:MAG TPA: hypothetical protein DCM05_07490, partial [Elusimicrobia bacterium]|nr:hypothetical protein [Elusimicrobiota bacterium]
WAGTVLTLGPVRAQLEGSVRRYALGDKTANDLVKLGLCWPLSRDLELRADLRRRTPHQEASLGMNFYF